MAVVSFEDDVEDPSNWWPQMGQNDTPGVTALVQFGHVTAAP